jgi:Domain of unknown function (DUF1902)
MAGQLIVVTVAFDREARVWFVEDSGELDGLNLEASSLEDLVDKLPGAVTDLLEANGLVSSDGDDEVPIEVIAHARTRARLSAAA